MASLKAEPVATIATSRGIVAGSRAGAATKKTSSSKFITRAATKMRPISVLFSARTPMAVLEDIRERYAAWVDPAPDDDEMVDLTKTAEWKKFVSGQTPGSWLAGMRGNLALTQSELGAHLGGVPAARVSDWEHDRRAVSKQYAKKMAKLFGVPAEYFL